MAPQSICIISHNYFKTTVLKLNKLVKSFFLIIKYILNKVVNIYLKILDILKDKVYGL